MCLLYRREPVFPTIAGYIDGPTLGHDVRILDEDTGEQMPDGEPGELCFMNPTPSAPLRFHGDDANYACRGIFRSL